MLSIEENFFEKIKAIYAKIPKREKTFMEISGFPHYENVCSNILSFYFNSQEEHGLENKVIIAFINALEKKKEVKLRDINLDTFKIFREYTTLKGNRIDIVLQNEDIVIGIENKIKAAVYNDLKDYSDTLESINENCIKILLTLHNEEEIANKFGFINITYNDFFESLKQELFKYKKQTNKWYIYLLDFITNLEGYKMEKQMDLEVKEWIKNNQEDVNKFLEILKIAKENINKKSIEYARLLENKILNNKVKYYNGNTYITSYMVFDLGCNLDAKLTVDGWILGVFVWKKSKQIEIRKRLIELGHTIIEDENNHFWLYKFDYDWDVEEVADKAKEIYELLMLI